MAGSYRGPGAVEVAEAVGSYHDPDVEEVEEEVGSCHDLDVGMVGMGNGDAGCPNAVPSMNPMVYGDEEVAEANVHAPVNEGYPNVSRELNPMGDEDAGEAEVEAGNCHEGLVEEENCHVPDVGMVGNVKCRCLQR